MLGSGGLCAHSGVARGGCWVRAVLGGKSDKKSGAALRAVLAGFAALRVAARGLQSLPLKS